jgi:cytochrome c-type biogenesis protein CcmH
VRQLAALGLGALLAFTCVAAELDTAFDDPALNERYWTLIREVRCPKCLNESIADSDAPVAADLRREVHRLVAEGKSDDEVKDFLSSRYGDFVLYRPRITAVTLLLWAAPVLFLLIGAIIAIRYIRRQAAEAELDRTENRAS